MVWFGLVWFCNQPLSDLTLTRGICCFVMNPRVTSEEAGDPNQTLNWKIACGANMNPPYGRTRDTSPPHLKYTLLPRWSCMCRLCVLVTYSSLIM